MINNKKALVEVDEILKYLPKEDLEKIPEEIRELIKRNKDKDYVWHMDKTKTLDEQELDGDTIVILSYINMEYLLNKEQKELMEKIHAENEKKLEKEKMEKYNHKDMFLNKNKKSLNKHKRNK